MRNKRGIGAGFWSMFVIVLVIIVFLFVFGIIKTDRIKNYFNKPNSEEIKQECGNYCNHTNKQEYCCISREILFDRYDRQTGTCASVFGNCSINCNALEDCRELICAGYPYGKGLCPSGTMENLNKKLDSAGNFLQETVCCESDAREAGSGSSAGGSGAGTGVVTREYALTKCSSQVREADSPAEKGFACNDTMDIDRDGEIATIECRNLVPKSECEGV